MKQCCAGNEQLPRSTRSAKQSGYAARALAICRLRPITDRADECGAMFARHADAMPALSNKKKAMVKLAVQSNGTQGTWK
jgi:hypothetical protein